MHKADAKARIQSCFERNDGVIYLAYSGGRDSNVVLSLCRTYFPNTSRVLVTKTEMFFPEVGKLIQEVSKTEKIFFNYTDGSLDKVIKELGFFCGDKQVMESIIQIKKDTKSDKFNRRYEWLTTIRKGKYKKLVDDYLADKVKLTNKCCRLIKNSKTKNDVGFITGLMRAESVSRRKTKCVNDKLKTINPIVDGTQKQVDDFIKEANVKIPECYSGVKRTGCLGCPYSLGTKKKGELFASHYPQRFEHLKALGLYDFLSTYIGKEKSDLLSDPTSEKPNKENEKVL